MQMPWLGNKQSMNEDILTTLTAEEVEMVSGGHPIFTIAASWGLAAEAVDFINGVIDGFNEQ